MYKKKSIFFIIILLFLSISWKKTDDSRQDALNTDLFLAIEQKNSETAMALMTYGAEMDAKDENDFTPLMYAVAVNDIKMVRHLVMYGADLKAKSKYGKTAFEYAKQLKRKSAIMILGRTGENEKIQMRINDKIRNIKDEINKNIFNSFSKDLAESKNWKRKQQLLKMKREVKRLNMLEKKLKKLQDENPAYKETNIKQRHIIATYKLRISKIMKKIKKYMEIERKKKLLERLRRLEEIKKKLERMRRNREKLRKLEKESKRLKWDVDKYGEYNDRSMMHRVLANLKTKYDRNRFKTFFKKGTGKILYTGKVSINSIINRAKQYLGQRYVFGGLDCSSLWQRVLKYHGINFPRTAELQARYGIIISSKKLLKRGDFLFFTRTYNTYWFISHIAMYLGNNKMLHAAKGGVQITNFPIPGYWWEKFYVFATRVF